MAANNYFKITFPARSRNEAFARVVVAAFAAQLDPTLEEINDIKTAVSEAVTNAIIHGYPDGEGEVEICGTLAEDGTLRLVVRDTGSGISNLDQAREPLYTTRPDLERSGMGFTIMENFMDSIAVETAPGKGTVVTMAKNIGGKRTGGHETN